MGIKQPFSMFAKAYDVFIVKWTKTAVKVGLQNLQTVSENVWNENFQMVTVVASG
jgi:hypothetical protein